MMNTTVYFRGLVCLVYFHLDVSTHFLFPLFPFLSRFLFVFSQGVYSKSQAQIHIDDVLDLSSLTDEQTVLPLPSGGTYFNFLFYFICAVILTRGVLAHRLHAAYKLFVYSILYSLNPLSYYLAYLFVSTIQLSRLCPRHLTWTTSP